MGGKRNRPRQALAGRQAPATQPQPKGSRNERERLQEVHPPTDGWRSPPRRNGNIWGNRFREGLVTQAARVTRPPYRPPRTLLVAGAGRRTSLLHSRSEPAGCPGPPCTSTAGLGLQARSSSRRSVVACNVPILPAPAPTTWLQVGEPGGLRSRVPMANPAAWA